MKARFLGDGGWEEAQLDLHNIRIWRSQVQNWDHLSSHSSHKFHEVTS